MEIIGYLGALFLSFCGLPQVVKCFKTRSASGLSWGFLLLWYFGEILTAIYVYHEHGLDIPLLINYGFNVILITIMIYYKGNPWKNSQ